MSEMFGKKLIGPVTANMRRRPETLARRKPGMAMKSAQDTPWCEPERQRGIRQVPRPGQDRRSALAMIPVKSELSGSVWKLQIEVGDRVDEGTDLIILESMKMEILVSAPSAGIVAEIRVAESESVTEGQVLAVLNV